jgi:hypothetical protein
LNHAKAVQLADSIARTGKAKVLSDSFFNEFTLQLPRPAAEVVEAMAKRENTARACRFALLSRQFGPRQSFAGHGDGDDERGRHGREICSALGEVL